MENKIKEYRKKKGVTQEQLAKAVDVSRQTIISLENEKPIPSIVLAYKIAEFFGVKIEEIFTLEEDPAILENEKIKRERTVKKSKQNLCQTNIPI